MNTPDTKITASPSNKVDVSPPLKGTIILDTPFIRKLEELDQHCRKLKFRPEKTLDELPLAGLTHLLQKGCNIIIPNEVLKETFTDLQNRMRLGLSIKDSKPTLDSDLFAKQKTLSPLFKEYLQNALASGKVQCFKSVDDYNKYTAANQSGVIAIINDKTRLSGNGIEVYSPQPRDRTDVRLTKDQTVAKSGKIGNGNAEILSILGKLQSCCPLMLLTIDKALAEKARDSISNTTGTPVQIKTIFTGGYLDMLHLSGFVDNPRTFVTLMNQTQGVKYTALEDGILNNFVRRLRIEASSISIP